MLIHDFHLHEKEVKRIMRLRNAKKKALVIFNHFADIEMTGLSILTRDEADQLINSFISDRDIKLYGECCDHYEKIRLYTGNLSQKRVTLSEAIEQLDKWCLIKKANSDMKIISEDLIGLITKKENKIHAEKIMSLYFEKDSIGKISPREIDKAIETTARKVREEQKNLKSAIVVAKDHFQETGFIIEAHVKFIEQTEDWLKSNLKGMFSVNYELPYDEIKVDKADHKRLMEVFSYE